MTLSDKIMKIVSNEPGLTEVEIAEKVYRRRGRHVDRQCRQLLNEKQLERHGKGGPGRPFKYYPYGTGG
jgi:hypothetical protein